MSITQINTSEICPLLEIIFKTKPEIQSNPVFLALSQKVFANVTEIPTNTDWGQADHTYQRMAMVMGTEGRKIYKEKQDVNTEYAFTKFRHNGRPDACFRITDLSSDLRQVDAFLANTLSSSCLKYQRLIARSENYDDIKVLKKMEFYICSNTAALSFSNNNDLKYVSKFKGEHLSEESQTPQGTKTWTSEDGKLALLDDVLSAGSELPSIWDNYAFKVLGGFGALASVVLIAVAIKKAWNYNQTKVE